MPQEMFGGIYISNDALLDLSPHQIFKPARALESMKFGQPLKRNTAQKSGRMLHETAIEEPASLEEHPQAGIGEIDQESAFNPPKGTPVSSIDHGTQPVLSTTSPHRGGDRGQDVKEGVTFDQRLRSQDAIINKDFDTSSPNRMTQGSPADTLGKLKFRPYPREVVKVCQ
ncbi:hypothetical protein PENSUB_5548 [Penicillium subrubescens]|uniref:Uncharacterized protein n=2 Tax=Penicillium subrubescens TaxID=1316194 RepID=A0A1Q5U7X5_9EURO|nr:hypothetical protein PENSUB_5548 [Penicillium subrubescens]